MPTSQRSKTASTVRAGAADIAIWTRSGRGLLAIRRWQPGRADRAPARPSSRWKGKASDADPQRRASPRSLRRFRRRFPIPADSSRRFRDKGIPGLRSHERAMRALAHATAYGQQLQAREIDAKPRFRRRPAATRGLVRAREQDLYYLGRRRTQKASSRRGCAEAKRSRRASVYPVVLRTRRRRSRTDRTRGGVALDIAGADATRRPRGGRVAESVAPNRRASRARDAGRGDAPRGVELIGGGRRDRHGGPSSWSARRHWTEALDDVRLMPADNNARRHHGRALPAKGRPPAGRLRRLRNGECPSRRRRGRCMARAMIARVPSSRDRDSIRGGDPRRVLALVPDHLKLTLLRQNPLDFAGWRERQEIRDGSVLRQIKGAGKSYAVATRSRTPRSPPGGYYTAGDSNSGQVLCSRHHDIGHFVNRKSR